MMYELAVFGVALVADRFLLRRNKVNIEKVVQFDDSKVVRFALGFNVERPIRSGTLTYSLRNKKRPTTVLTHRRALDFTPSGSNLEYITFERNELELESGEPVSGQWVLDIKIERSCSLVNPLYKILPVTTRFSEEYEIE